MDKMYNKSEELWSILPYYDYKNEMSQEHRIWSIFLGSLVFAYFLHNIQALLYKEIGNTNFGWDKSYPLFQNNAKRWF